MSTAPSTRPLSDTARHVCKPAGIVSTGWGSVEDRCRLVFGVGFDRWQKDIGALALSKRENGLYAAAVGGVVLSIPRQTGKTYLVAWMVFALCTLIPNLTVVWTAHRTRTSDETFGKMKAMALRPKVRPYIEGKPRAANGQQEIAFVNGSRVLFGAREQGFGRGFDMVDILILDEAQILTESAMTDMVPATNAAPNGLVIMMGTPPRPKDPGEVFTARRQDGLDQDPDTLYVELSAQRGAKIIDWAQLAIANPSFPHRTGKTAILRMQKLLGSDINFYREAYGIWDEVASATARLVSADEWAAIQTDEAPAGGIKSFAVAYDFDSERAAVAGAVRTPDLVHLELVSALSGGGMVTVDAVADWLAARWRDTACIALVGGSRVKVLYQELRDRKVPERVIKILTTPDYLASTAMLHNSVKAKQVTVPKAADPATDVLEASVSICDQKKRTTGWGWTATTPDGDATPMDAISAALWAARTSKRQPGRQTKAVTM